ncbi:Phosphatase PHOSPHO-type [Macleaya cordata]|uniref:Phosphatase PHOSPHO-type n=1 Tax=Macleaya cordata TaxID=56857 RepID=A0A200QLJ8_MACCD|nr:Phosphatase PHOSPHO-type [Macleaya cordata]
MISSPLLMAVVFHALPTCARDSAFEEGKKRFIYLGDGVGDFCPSLKLREGDFVMPRKNYLVWELISSNKLVQWSIGDERKWTLLRLINTIINENQNNSTTCNSSSASLVSVDFKPEPLFNHLVHPVPSLSSS